jgi:hypothetical protein
MKDYSISMFIDNELDLDEKIDFVETVHSEQAFKDEAIDLLEQEKLLHSKLVHQEPRVQIPVETEQVERFFTPWLRPVALFSASLALGAAVLFIQPTFFPFSTPTATISREVPYRFVIYRPNASHADIIGTFTSWQPVAMNKMGESGYWSLTLTLPEGEYQYSYLVEEGKQIVDPTISERVQDDFGGENSLITIEV